MNPQPELFAPHPAEPTTSLAEERRAREEEVKRNVLKRMKAEVAGWLHLMRSELAKVYEHRVISWYPDEAFVTADDARNLMRAYPDRFGLPGGASTNTLGALFLTREWVPVDTDPEGRAIALHVSTTPGSRGNHLVRWKLADGERRAAA